MEMVNYVIYNAAVNTSVSLTLTGKGKIVGISWSIEMIGGAAPGINGFSLVKNTIANVASTWATNGPQKSLVLLNHINRTEATTGLVQNGAMEGLSFDYSSGDVLTLLNLNNGGTAPTSSIMFCNIYAVEN